MDTKNLKKLRDVIAESETFDQKCLFHHECGTPGCVAGHAALLARGDAKFGGDIWRDKHIMDDARTWLDLTPAQECVMFDAHPLDKYWTEKGEVLTMLDRAIETGKVRWK